MKRQEEKKESRDQFQSSIESSPGSMILSILLVALSIGFVFGFKYYLAGKNYHGPDISADGGINEGKESGDGDVLDKDGNFQYQYIMIQDLKGKEVRPEKQPGEKGDSTADPVSEGQILKVLERGNYGSKRYYLLEDGSYLPDSRSIMPLKEYIELEGYLTITYISSSGVKLRKWADFKADNIAGSVYVGDKVNVKARITTVDDIVAFLTEEGYYITTNSRYLNDHTTVVN